MYSDVIREELESKYSYFDSEDKKQVNWELVQKEMTSQSKWFNRIPGLARLVLAHSEIERVRNLEAGLGRKFEISNAAGMNKLGAIPPLFLYYLGFDRVQVGTVTGKPWNGTQGVEGGRIVLLPEEFSALNCLGLPGDGPDAVALNLDNYRHHNVPIDINYMATPDSSFTLKDKIKDIKLTLRILKSFGERFILNFSCPNTEDTHILSELFELLEASREVISDSELYVKLGPIMSYEQGYKILDGSQDYHVSGFITTNTNPAHNRKTRSWRLPGGMSGKNLYDNSFDVQKMISRISQQYFDGQYKLIACGGISSVQDLRQRAETPNTIGAELYTRLMFPGGFEELRKIKRETLDLSRRLN